MCIFKQHRKNKIIFNMQKLNSLKHLVKFTDVVYYNQIYYLPYFDNFTNITISNIYIIDNKPLQIINKILFNRLINNDSIAYNQMWLLNYNDIKIPNNCEIIKIGSCTDIFILKVC